MLSNYIILNILKFNHLELVKYYRAFYKNNTVKTAIKKIISTELYKWQYFLTKHYSKRLVEKALYSNVLDIVKYGVSMGAPKHKKCLNSTNIDILAYYINLKNKF